MRLGQRSRLLTATLLTLLLALAAGCGDDKDPRKDSAMTPEKANEAMREMAAAVMGVAVPDEKVELPASATPIPCGGLEGSDFTKIKYGVLLRSQQALTTADEAFRTSAAKLRDLGYDVDPAETMGDTTSMNFNGEVAGGVLTWHGSGPISLNVETECLDNPDPDGSATDG